jgi:hypothetical protein
MFPNERFRLTRQAALLAVISAAFPVAGYAAAAGRVDFAIGEVTATGPDGKARALAKGAEVNPGDTIVTGASGRAHIRFSDGAYSSLQPQTTFRIDEYKYPGQADGTEKGFFSLAKGALRTITGVIGRVNRNSYKVSTPTATIGIRGTEYLAREINSLDVNVGEGSIEVCNAAGCIIISEGESAFVPDANTQPTLSPRKAGVPAPPPSPLYTFEKGDEGFLAQLPLGALLPGAAAIPTLPSGPGYAFAGEGFIDFGSATPVLVQFLRVFESGVATFSGADLLSYDPDVGNSFSGTPVGALTDGTIGWGRWSSGFEGITPLINVHYAVGQATPAADMSNLAASNLVGTYSLLGFTFPTSNTGLTGTVTGGSLTAFFGSGSVGMDLGVAIGGQNFDLSGSGGISGSTFGMFLSCVTANCFGDSVGIFVGPNASRAGVAYGFDSNDQTIGSVSGAATFSQTSLTPGGLTDSIR